MRILFVQGLRWAILLGATGNALGSWIKVLSVAPDRFWLTFIGQTVVAVSQTFVLSVPARLAAVWFGPDQVSSACSIGVFGNQVSWIEFVDHVDCTGQQRIWCGLCGRIFMYFGC